MNRLVDANVWLALLVGEHIHHRQTRAWFETAGAGEAVLCRVVQLTLVRLLGTRTIMAEAAMPAAQAWAGIQELLGDERVIFLQEPPGLDAALPPLFRYPVPTQGLVMDAYLAAFALTAGHGIVTWDRGFQQFRGLDVLLLSASRSA